MLILKNLYIFFGINALQMHESSDLKIKEAMNHLWGASEFMGWHLGLDICSSLF